MSISDSARRGRRSRLVSATALAVAAGWVSVGPAAAATITPDVLTDDVTRNGNCTLREAVKAANTDLAVDGCAGGAGADTVVLAAAEYVLTLPQAADAPTSEARGDLDLTTDISIRGSGIGSTSIRLVQGELVANEDGVVEVVGPARVSLEDLAVTGGRVGGLRSSGDLTLVRVAVRGNGSESDGYAGGITNSGRLTATGSVVNGNGYRDDVAAIINSGTATLTDTRITNHATRSGPATLVNAAGGTFSMRGGAVSGTSGYYTFGGVLNAGTMTLDGVTLSGHENGALSNKGALTLRNSTVAANTPYEEAVLANAGTAVLSNTTITGNGPGSGAPVLRNAGTLHLRSSTVAGNALSTTYDGLTGRAVANDEGGVVDVANSIVSGNTDETGGPADCSGAVVSLGYNVFGAGGQCAGTAPATGDTHGVDALLGAPAQNGGATATMAPRPGSPAIDAGSPATPGGSDGACPTTDQRGRSRPQIGAAGGAARCDIGAFEVVGPFAVDDAYSVTAGAALSVSAPGVLGNDSGVSENGAPHTAAVDTAPAHAAAFALNADGSFSYTPAAGFSGNDSFTSRGVDGTDRSSTTARVTISVTASSTGANLVRNPSFETSTTGWGGVGGALSRVAVTGAPDGASVARVRWSSGTSYSVSDSASGFGPTVPSVTAGQTYLASCHVRAANSGTVGKRVRIVLRERTSSGAFVRQTTATATLSSGWKRLSVATGTSTSGHSLGLRCEQTSAVSGNAFDADLMSVTSGFAVGGSGTAGTVWTNASPNAKRVSSFSLTTTREVASTRAYLDGRAATSGSQPVRVVIYAGTASGPTGRIATSGQVTISAGRQAGWVAISFAAPVRLAPGTYWIGLHTGGTTTVVRFASEASTGALRFNGDSYSDGAASTFGTASATNKRLSLYAIGA